MSFLKLSLFPILVFCLFASVKAQTAKVIYDGRKNSETAKMNSADEKLLKSVILPKAREFWKNAEGCEETFDIRDFTRGSFYRAEQRTNGVSIQFLRNRTQFRQRRHRRHRKR